jgi:hypothetical protein
MGGGFIPSRNDESGAAQLDTAIIRPRFITVKPKSEEVQSSGDNQLAGVYR